MPWFQPTFKAPTGALYLDKNHSHGGLLAGNTNAADTRTSRETEADSTLLSRRILSLLSPLVSSCPSTTSQVRNMTHGPLSFLIGQLPLLSSYQSRYPHPSFQVRYNQPSRRMQHDSDDYVSIMGHRLHALFFHPRKIITSQPQSLHRGICANDGPQRRDSTTSDAWQYDKSGGSTPNDPMNQLGPCHDSLNNHDDQTLELYPQGMTNELLFNRALSDNDTSPHPHRFGYIYNHPDDDAITGNNATRRRKKNKTQRQIVQNHLDGSLRTDSSLSSLQKERGWAQIGQIAPYQTSVHVGANNVSVDGVAIGTTSGNGKKRKGTTKEKRKKKSKQKKSIPDIQSALMGNRKEKDDMSRDEDESLKRDSIDHSSRSVSNRSMAEGLGNDDEHHSSSKTKTRVFPRDTSRRSDSNRNYNTSSSSTPNYESIPITTMQTFAETYEVNNAGASIEALRMFSQLVKQQKYVSWTMVFHDAVCSTPFLPYTKKYCTPKGLPCTMWNCVCDNQVRAMQASAPLVGAMFVFPMNVEDDESDHANYGTTTTAATTSGNNNKQALDCFLLPLGPTEDPDDGPSDIDSGFERMARWPFLKICCGTTLRERWDVFGKILRDKSVVKVTYQAQVGLMPYHYHCAFDVSSDSQKGENDDDVGKRLEANEFFGYLHLVLPNIWDLRLASWMLTPHEKEENLELDHKRAGFAHMYPNLKYDRPVGASPQLLGLVKAKEDLEFLYILYPTIDALLERNGLKDAFRDIESPLQSVLSSMECFGIGFKPERLMKIQENIESQIQNLISEAKSLTKDDDFLISSPQQVSQLLYGKLGLSIPSNARSEGRESHLSTSEECLQDIQNGLRAKGEQGLRIIDIILEFRALNKVLGTYIRPYPKLARGDSSQIRARKSSRRSKKKNGSDESQTSQKIHPMWMQTAVQTGRLSCRKPNMQQVPTGSVIKGVYPRNFFTSSVSNSCLFACDYSQNEVRILAHMSKDEALIRLFSQPGSIDIYKQMAGVISSKNPADVGDEERAVSKQVTLAIMYGMGLNTVAKKLGVDKVAAKAFFESFYGRFRGVKQWMDSTIAKARRDKYVTTITGRRRYLDDISSTDGKVKNRAERQAINTVIQGSAADLMKLAMLKMASRISDWRKEGSTGHGEIGAPPRLLLQIHDELVFELPANEADVNRLKAVVIRTCTEECVEELHLRVPLKLKCSVGITWGDMTEID